MNSMMNIRSTSLVKSSFFFIQINFVFTTIDGKVSSFLIRTNHLNRVNLPLEFLLKSIEMKMKQMENIKRERNEPMKTKTIGPSMRSEINTVIDAQGMKTMKEAIAPR